MGNCTSLCMTSQPVAGQNGENNSKAGSQYGQNEKNVISQEQMKQAYNDNINNNLGAYYDQFGNQQHI